MKSILWGLAWTPDGRDIIFSSGFMAHMSLWKVSASGAGKPEPLPFTGEGIYPTISRSGNRLAYQNAVCDTNIWRLSLSDPGMAAGAPSLFIASTRAEQGAQYSPDGKRIAFESDHSGRRGIWVSDADGSNTRGTVFKVRQILRDPTLVTRWATHRLRILTLKGISISISSGQAEESPSA